MSRPNKNGYRVMGAIILFALCLTTACDPHGGERQVAVVVTEPVMYDTDDPAIWYNKENPEASLIIGTDKDEDGALYVFDLDGKIVQDKVVRNLKRPNNVDVVDGFVLGSDTIAMAGTGERLTHQLRLFSVPDMKPLDGGGIPVFEGETGAEYRDLMGIAFYKRPSDGQVYAIMGRKNGPTDGTYLWQYALEGNEQGEVSARLVRKFGQFSGVKEIEAIAVDHELGYVYYSDEGVGVRKYHADPEKGNEELAFFGIQGFTDDHEGVSIFNSGGGKGFIIVSDQQAAAFRVFPREGSTSNPHQHDEVHVAYLQIKESDGSEIDHRYFNENFPNGIFVAMSDDKTFQYYRPEDILPLQKEEVKQ